MLYARVLRSPHPHARIVRIDASKALAHARREGGHLARELHGRLGRRVDLRRRAVQRRDQEDHQAPPLRVQQPGAIRRRAGGRRRRGRSSHRRRGAAADRGRLRAAAVRARSRGGAQARRPADLARRQPVARTRATSTCRLAQKRGNVEEGFAASDQVFEDRYSTAFVHNAQMEPRVVRRGLGRRQAHRLHADRRHRQLPHRHGARPRHPAGKGPRRLPVHGRQLRQQEPESGRRSDRRDAGEERRRAGEARAVAQGRLHRRARPLADGAVLQGRRQERRHAAGDPAARLQRHGTVPQEHRQHRRRRDLSVPEHRDVDLAGLHQPDRVGELPRDRSSRRASSASSR